MLSSTTVAVWQALSARFFASVRQVTSRQLGAEEACPPFNMTAAPARRCDNSVLLP